jgi:phospholipid-binding lipoprotein MlaA
LGVWGAKAGAYLVLPLLGPSTVRDIFGKVVDMPLDPTRYNDDVSERNALLALKATHKRAMLLPATDLIDRVALDKYAFVRDAYLARRESLIRDGAAENKDPLELDDEDDKPIEQQPTSGQTPSTTTPTSLLGKPEPSVLIPNQAPSATMASSGQTTTLGVAFAANLKPSDRTQQLLGWPVLVK